MGWTVGLARASLKNLLRLLGTQPLLLLAILPHSVFHNASTLVELSEGLLLAEGPPTPVLFAVRPRVLTVAVLFIVIVLTTIGLPIGEGVEAKTIHEVVLELAGILPPISPFLNALEP